MNARGHRIVELLPFLAAMGLNALVHDRWLLAVPVAALVLWAAWRGWELAAPAWTQLGAGAAGALVGLALLWYAEPPTGPIPPNLLSPLCAGLVGLGTQSLLRRQVLYAWTHAALLAVLSLNVPPKPGLFAGMGLFLLALAVCGAVQGGVLRSGAVGALAFVVFGALAAGGAAALALTMHSSEGALMRLIYNLTYERELPRGYGLDGQFELSRGSKVQSSDRALFEVSGGDVAKLRTTVLDQFDGERWTRSFGEGRLPEAEVGRTLTLSFVEDLGRILPAPAGTVRVEGARFDVFPGAVLSVRARRGSEVRIEATAREELAPEPAPSPSSLKLPEALAAELAPFARQIVGSATTARARAEAIEQFFRDGFEYSLQVDLSGEGSPLAVLIRERRAAYCSYFASAMAALLRVQGVPARVVGGFVPAERNPFTGDWTVRERDAHAWVEAYLAEEGRFVAFDPTPWRSRDTALGVDREPSVIAAAFGAAGKWLRQGWRSLVEDPLGALARAVRSPVAWVLVAGVAGWLWLRRRRGPGRARRERGAMLAEDVKLRAVRERYARLLRQATGKPPAPAKTDEELVVQLRVGRGERAGAAAEAFLREYRRARFRGEPVDPAQLAALLDTLERELSRAA